jgi:hypothetical protein
MVRRIVVAAALFALCGVVAPAQERADEQNAQKPAAAQKAETPKAEPQKAEPRPPEGKPINVKIEVTITDQTGSGSGTKKLISLMTSDRRTGNVRSNTDVRMLGSYRSITINVDAQPTLIDDERLKLELGLDYQPEPPSGPERDSNAPPLSRISERFGGLILHSGKPMIVSQAADPTSDRKVTVEVTATILK